jgi:hypothetical protein
MKKSVIRFLGVMSLLSLQACGGGGDDSSTGGTAPTSAGITESDVALYARAVNTYAVNCSRYGYYQDCTSYDNAVYYFNSKCYQGVQQACSLSQDIQASFTLARLVRGF